MRENPIQKIIELYQRNEITEYHLYKRIARNTKSEKNRKILLQIAEDEFKHYNKWKSITGKDITPAWSKIWFYVILAKVLGIVFSFKLMEKGEESAQKNYSDLSGKIENIDSVIDDEGKHEEMLLELLDEERLHYMGSIVLGLNDALVELTGGLAGLTLALREPQLIALSGIIIGIAAALSMAASEYLSTKAEKSEKHPMKSSVYTGIAYIFTVVALVFPYLVFSNPLISLVFMLVIGILIIALFNYYISVALNKIFKRAFLEMLILSLCVAAVSFGIGYAMRIFFGIDV